MFTLTITLKVFMIFVISTSIYITTNLWIVNFINTKLSSKLDYSNNDPFIDISKNIFKYMFTTIFLLFNMKELMKESMYNHNCTRLKWLNDWNSIYTGDEFDLERTKLIKEIHKYETYIKLKKLEKKSIFNIKKNENR